MPPIALTDGPPNDTDAQDVILPHERVSRRRVIGAFPLNVSGVRRPSIRASRAAGRLRAAHFVLY